MFVQALIESGALFQALKDTKKVRLNENSGRQERLSVLVGP